MLAKLEGKAVHLGLQQGHIESTKTAQRFYLSRGYREQSARATGMGIAMVKELTGGQLVFCAQFCDNAQAVNALKEPEP